MEKGGNRGERPAPGYRRVPTLWNLLNSMGFTIGTLAVLVIVSAIGVIVPQGAPESVYLQKYGTALGRLVLVAGADHMFRVWWYVALWGVVVAGLVVCSFNRLPSIVRSAFGKPLLANPTDYKTYRLNACFQRAMPPDRAFSEAKSLLRRKGYRLHEGDRQGGGVRPLLAHKGGLERFGPFVTHMSIVVVLAGGMLASLAGARHNQPAFGGDTFEVPDLSHRERAGFHLDRLLGRSAEEDLLLEEMGMMDWRKLPDIPEKATSFRVRVDEFWIDRTPEGMVADYKTRATVFDPDSLFDCVIEVNKPLVHRGYHFYQSSYGYSSRSVENVHLLVTDKTGAPVAEDVTLPFFVPVEVPGTGLTVKAADFAADFVYDIETGTGSSRSDEHRNPAVKIEVYRGNEKLFDQWLMLRGMGGHSSKDDQFDFRVVSYDPDMYTVLEVRTHPLLNVVWTGFGMAIAGLFLSFYVTQRRVWAGVREGAAGGSEVFLAAASRKGKESLKREFESFVNELGGKAK